MGDFVKGSDYENYPIEIKNGILLHRQIDSFTDAHPIVLKSKKRLHTHYGHYSGIVVDIFYDHFLAKNWSMYTHLDLKEFTQYFYTILQTNYSIVPSKIQHMLPYMIKEDWLYNYQFLEGIQQVMYGMERRIKFRKKLSESVRELHLHYEDFNQEFIEFFPQLEVFTAFEKEKLINR